MTTITKTCERCETAEATMQAFYFGCRSQTIECCESCFEDLMLDGEYEATAVTR